MTKTSFPAPKNNYLYLPDGWDTGWKAAKAAAASSPAHIMCLGDSIANGTTQVSSVAKRFPELVQASLVATYGKWGDHFTGQGDSAVFTAISDPWFVVQNAATWTLPPSDSGWLRGLYTGVTGSASRMKFTTPYACTSLDIVWIDQYPGTWQFVIGGGSGTYTYTLFDGQTGGTGTIGSNVTITNLSAAGNVAANARVRKMNITGLTSAVHTIDFGWQSATAVCMLGGVSCYTGNAGGISLSRINTNGAKANSITSGATVPLDIASLYSGKYPQNDATGVGTGTFGYPLNPHLLIYQLLVNSCHGADATSSTGGALVPIIDGIRRTTPNASVVLVIPSYPRALYYDTTTGFLHPEAYYTYSEIVYQIARTYNCAVVNMHAKWGQTPFAQGFLANNDIHPKDAGQADIANTILSIL